MKFNKRFYKSQEFGKRKRPNEQSFNEKEKVPPKVRKLNALTAKVWDTLLMIILSPKISKSLCRLLGVIPTLKKVFPQLLKMQYTILMTS